MSRYMICITLSYFADFADATQHLDALGVAVDDEFGAVSLNTEGSKLLVRGDIEASTIPQINRIPGFDLFPDFPVGSVEEERNKEQ